MFRRHYWFHISVELRLDLQWHVVHAEVGLVLELAVKEIVIDLIICHESLWHQRRCKKNGKQHLKALQIRERFSRVMIKGKSFTFSTKESHTKPGAICGKSHTLQRSLNARHIPSHHDVVSRMESSGLERGKAFDVCFMTTHKLQLEKEILRQNAIKIYECAGGFSEMMKLEIWFMGCVLKFWSFKLSLEKLKFLCLAALPKKEFDI